MASSEIASTPPFSWSDQDIAFVATQLSREFLTATPIKIADAVEKAARQVSAHEGRVSLAKAARQIVSGSARYLRRIFLRRV